MISERFEIRHKGWIMKSKLTHVNDKEKKLLLMRCSDYVRKYLHLKQTVILAVSCIAYFNDKAFTVFSEQMKTLSNNSI
ncbi:CLUMA_CG002072, isoform A [Clunio marinus]|uniref:CLUMA_CG002072, isoform A n=1 Tax=Clunio marinus TaxID=568069 RepID=A0A1J1HJU1_9DIPT|nr:CLUMA_CG002072, isoform A [Clunio marinus]